MLAAHEAGRSSNRIVARNARAEPPSANRVSSQASLGREGLKTRDPLRDPFGAGIRTESFARTAPSIASSEGSWRLLHSAFVFPPPSQAGRRGFESHRPLFGSPEVPNRFAVAGARRGPGDFGTGSHCGTAAIRRSPGRIPSTYDSLLGVARRSSASKGFGSLIERKPCHASHQPPFTQNVPQHEQRIPRR